MVQRHKTRPPPPPPPPTKTSSSQPKCTSPLPHYEVYRNNRNIFGGGVFILVHKSITSSEEPHFVTDCKVEWVKVKMKSQKDLHVGAFYTPDRNPKDSKELNKSLNKLTDNGKKQREVILAGDFNYSDMDWATHSVGSTGKDQEAQQPWATSHQTTC